MLATCVIKNTGSQCLGTGMTFYVRMATKATRKGLFLVPLSCHPSA
ncbi:hypothetical protein HCR18_03740 [Wolbachia pipientis]|nr:MULTISPECIES: hypothetical protein [Wolbachia]MBA8758167.1 hypothetical protein [Wolbachia pipientis]MBA8770361.1 hypothetical protein [Wolbachia pipientis]MDE5058950.1 hypothetical protein [Wolbachia endosymbiont of Drosophila baimaii]